MKRYAWLLVLAVGAVARGDLAYSGNPVSVSPPLNIFDAIALDYGESSLGFPGIEIVQKPWADVSGFEEGISEVRITPSQPTTEDEVFAAVSGWKPDPDYVLDYANVTMAGEAVWLDLYWHNRPPIPTIPPVSTNLPVTLTSEGSGIGNSQLSSVAVGQAIPLIPPVTQYVISPFNGTRYEVRESLGILSPGAYALYVTNHGPVPGSLAVTFNVREPASIEGFPWSPGPLYPLVLAH